MKTPSIKKIKEDFEHDLFISEEVNREVYSKRNPLKEILSFIISIFGPLF